MKILDLFSGIGGFSLAGRWAQMETIQFVEIDPFCRKVLAKNFPNIPIHDDIKTFDATSLHRKIDVLTGGFPCQPFSCAGKKKGNKDDRYLWPEMLRVIQECRPHWIIGENVPGIIPVLDPVLESLEMEGYDWRAFLIPASALGAPHKRERLWIIAHAIGEHGEQRTSNPPSHSERPERAQSSATVRDAGNYDGKSISKTDQISIPFGETRNAWKNNRFEYWNNITRIDWEKIKPPICGMDDGLPFGVDRNRALGNAIVPQIAYMLMAIIQSIEESN